MSGLAPLGLNIQDLTTYGSGIQTFTVSLVRNTSDPFGPGGVLGLSLDNTPSKPVGIWKDELRTGATQKVVVGGMINSINADQAQQNALYDVIAERLAQGPLDLPVLILPSKAQTVGTSQHEVISLAYIRVISVGSTDSGSGNSGGGGGNGGGNGGATAAGTATTTAEAEPAAKPPPR